MTRIRNDKLEKLKLSFRRCANLDGASLKTGKLKTHSAFPFINIILNLNCSSLVSRMLFVKIITCLPLYSALRTVGLAVEYYSVVSLENECGYVNSHIKEDYFGNLTTKYVRRSIARLPG